MSASKGIYTTETVSHTSGEVHTMRLTQDGRIMVDATSGGGAAGATETTLAALNAKVGAAAAGADGVSNPTVGVIRSFLSAFNGTTWDRVRTAVVTVSSTLTGFLNTLPWAIYHSTPATRTNTQGGPLETDATGNLRNVEQFAPVAEDNTAGVIKVENRYTYDFTTGTTAGKTIKSGAGFIHNLVIGLPAANAVVTLYDNTAASGTVIFKTTYPAALLSTGPVPVLLDVVFTTGLTLVVATAGVDITIGWR